MIRTVLQKSRNITAAAIAFSVLTASVAAILPTNSHVYAAANCDKVNIVYCGVEGTTAAQYIAEFKKDYAGNKSGHIDSPTVKKDYTDLQAIYKWAGATDAIVNGMSTANTKVGTLYRDGHIAVDGKTVATDAWVSARFTNGGGFTNITGNVYARKTTTSFEHATAPVIVYMNNDQAVFAVMISCGNAVKITPVKTPTPPTPPTTPETPKTPQTPVTPQAPAQLPSTGAGETIGLFSGITMAGASAHRIISARRRAK